MIFDNIEHYFVTDIKFAKAKFDIYVPEYMIEEMTDDELDTAIRSYAFYYLEPDFKFTKLEAGNTVKINIEYDLQSFNADDADTIHEHTKQQSGILLTDISLQTRKTFIVPFDYNCIKYQAEMKADEVIEQEIFEHMMWSLPVFVFRLNKKKFA